MSNMCNMLKHGETVRLSYSSYLFSKIKIQKKRQSNSQKALFKAAQLSIVDRGNIEVFLLTHSMGIFNEVKMLIL